jgi:uncharacterized protein YdeI (YjbR/CyaY-like superfamily)
MKPAFFETPTDFRAWLAKHHATAKELLVGFYKKGSKRPSITWPESVDEALCYGWIDSARKGIDAQTYTIRFTPRKNGSVWSNVNVNRVRALIDLGRMRPAGLKAFETRKEGKSGIYSHEQGEVELPEPYQGLLRANKKAWEFFQKQAGSYRKAATWWVTSAKKEETRRKRLDALIAHSVKAERIPQFTWKKSARSG